MYDPYNLFGGESQNPMAGIYRRPVAPKLPELTPEDEEGLLSRLGGKVMGGLGYIGSSLDKALGGRAVRGLLGGKPQELLSIVPFSDTIGLTNEANKVEGKDLLDQIGLINKHDDSWLNTIGGAAAEMALDPGTYLTFGGAALSSLGKAASKIGVLPAKKAAQVAGLASTSSDAAKLAQATGKSIAEVAGQKLGGHVGVGLPFMDPAFVADLSKPLEYAGKAGEFAAKLPGIKPFADAGKAVYEASKPIGRGLGALFDTSKAGQTSEIGQEFGQLKTKLQKEYETQAREQLARGLRAAGKDIGQSGQEVRRLAEGTLQPNQALPGSVAAWQEFDPMLKDARMRAVNKGAQIPERQWYYPRKAVNPDLDIAGGQGVFSDLGMGSPDMVSREKIFDVPGQTETLEKLMRDPAIRNAASTKEAAKIVRQTVGYTKLKPAPMTNILLGAPDTAAAAQLAEMHLGLSGQQALDFADSVRQATSPGAAKRMVQDQLTSNTKQVNKLADFVRSTNEKRLDIGMFNRSPFQDAQDYMLNRARSDAAMDAAYRTAAKYATSESGAGAMGRPLLDAIKSMGLKTKEANAAMLDSLVRAGVVSPAQVAAITSKGSPANQAKKITKLLNDFYLPRDAYDALTKTTPSFKVPGVLKPLTDLYDSGTNLFKGAITSPWPGFNVRNLLGGVWQNLTSGVPLTDIPAAYRDARALNAGKIVDNLASHPWAAGLSAADATQAVSDLAFKHNVLGHGHLADVVADQGVENVMKQLPGLVPRADSLIEAGKNYAKGVIPKTSEELNPLNMVGVGGRTEAKFAPARAGREFADDIDSQARLANFIALGRQGYSPEVAAELVAKHHIDYQNLTAFEKQVMRRLLPFYCVPDHSEILTRDGWKNCDDLAVGEEVMTYNAAGDYLEWQKCEGKHIFDHDQELLVFENGRRKLQFTHDHRWHVRQGGGTVTHSYGTHTYPEKHKVVTGGELNRNHSIICTAGYLGTESIVTPDQARLIGWIVTDGYYRRRRNCGEAVVYQSPKKFLQEVSAVAGGKPKKPHPESGVIAVPVLKHLLKEVEQYLDKSKLPQFVTRLSRPAAEAMYDAMYKADGTVSEGRKGNFFAKEREDVRSAFRILALMLGKQTSNGKKGCYISDRRYMQIAAGVVREEHYKGRVWCPSTANGTWVMKQNGVITITGNSWQRHNLPNQIEQVLTKPGGLSSQAIKTTSRLEQDQDGFTPDYLSRGMAIPLGEGDNGTRRYLSSIGLPFEDLGQLMNTGGVGRTGEQFLSSLNPMLKAPLEFFTGRQFYSGRELADLGSYGLTGMTPLDHLLMNSPASRALTASRTLSDERKGVLDKALNLLTGAKVTDVDMERQRDIATREFIERYFQGNPNVSNFERLSPKKGRLEHLTPEEISLLQLYAAQQKRGVEAAKKRQAEAAQAGQ